MEKQCCRRIVYGGAVAVFTSEKVTFTNCIFDSNGIYNTNSNNSRGGKGGAVYFEDMGATNFTTITHEFNNCTFKNNYSIGYENVGGGAIHTRRQVSIDNSVFAGNYAKATDSNGDNYVNVFGGAIDFYMRHWDNFNGTAVGRISNSVFDNNSINMISPNGDPRGGTIPTGHYDSGNVYSRVYIFNTIITRNGYLQNGSAISSYNHSEDITIIGAGNSDGYKTIVDYSIIQGSEGKNIRGIGDYVYDVEPAFTIQQTLITR